MKVLAALAVLLVVAGCACDQSRAVSVQPLAAPMASPCAPAVAQPAPFAAGPCATAPMAYAAPGNLGVAYSYDAASYARAGLAIPAGVIACGTQWIADLGAITAKGILCIGTALTPTPQPSARLVQLVPVEAKGACAPPAAASPCGR